MLSHRPRRDRAAFQQTGEIVTLEKRIAKVRSDLDLWNANLVYAIEMGRELGLDVAEDGEIRNGFQAAFGHDQGSDVIIYGIDKADMEREPTPEEAAKLQENARAKVNSWMTSTASDSDYAEMPTSPSTRVGSLLEPDASDSVSNCLGGTRWDFGYSVYRIQIDEMEKLRDIARAQM